MHPILLLTALAFLFGCSADTTITDTRDGKKYKTVKIGEQLWMAENLNYEAEGSKCYDNDPANCEKYGRLYDWETANKSCPKVWHLPNDKEWDILIDFAGGKSVAGEKLKAKKGWNADDDGKSGNGTDEYGFAALPGGIGNSSGSFVGIGNRFTWWRIPEINALRAYYMSIDYFSAGISDWAFSNKTELRSVRCIRY